MAKLMTARQMRDKSPSELQLLLQEARQEVFALLNAAQRAKKYDRPHLKRHKRTEIARLLTVMNSKRAEARGCSC